MMFLYFIHILYLLVVEYKFRFFVVASSSCVRQQACALFVSHTHTHSPIVMHTPQHAANKQIPIHTTHRRQVEIVCIHVYVWCICNIYIYIQIQDGRHMCMDANQIKCRDRVYDDDGQEKKCIFLSECE